MSGTKTISDSDATERKVAQPRSICAALDFLLRRQDQDGAWRDFQLKPGASDSWVTAYVAQRLLVISRNSSLPRIGDALREAADFLEGARGPQGGWGYNRFCVVDCDSTAHAILFLHQYNGGALPVDYISLIRFQKSNGAFATYHAIDPSHGWGHGHPDVTAVAVRALCTRLEVEHSAIQRALRYLTSLRQRPDFLASYWWPTTAYMTRELCELSRMLDAPSLSPGPFEAVRPVGGSCFEMALDLEIAAYHDKTGVAVGRKREALESLQLADGSWPSAPILRITDPRSQVIGDTFACSSPIAWDLRRIFTTATALSALHKANLQAADFPDPGS